MEDKFLEILVHRKYKKTDYTISNMFIDGEFVCNVIEDTDRGLHDGMQDFMIRSRKIPTKTAVPTGRYEVLMNVVSPKFSQKPFYMEVCKGKVPRLKNVKGFEGILIHAGSDHTHSAGCLLVGKNTIRGKLTESQETFKKIYALMKKAYDKGEKIFINIE